MSVMWSDRQSGPCGNKLLERLLPQGKFGNMESGAASLCGRSLSIC
jgi:hypothetical protein